MSKGGSKQPTQTTSTVTQTDLPAYAQPYVTDVMQRAQALSRQPYEANPNPRIAPFSGDQLNAFAGARNLGNVGTTQFGQANAVTGLAGLRMGGAGYNPNAITSPYTGQTYNPSAFNADNVSASNINADAVNTGQWNAGAMAQYMDPFLQSVMDTTLARNEGLFARDQLDRNSRATRSGAFGGLRQGVEDGVARSEFLRNTAQQEAALLSQGYNTAFQGFTSDQARGLQASMANQATNLEAARANQASGLTAQQANQSAGLEAQRQAEASRQFGANFNDSSQRAIADYAIKTGTLNEQNAQRASELGMQQASGLASIGAQYANLGETERNAAMQNIEALRTAGLDQQRQTQASLDLANEDFINQRDYEWQMLNMYNSILRGMPMTPNTNVISYEQSNPYSQFLGLGLGAAGIANALN